jgi:hypothetical protein
MSACRCVNLYGRARTRQSHLFWSVIPTYCYACLSFLPTMLICNLVRKYALNVTRYKDVHLLRQPAPKHLSDNRPAGIIWVAEMQPICEPHCPTLVVHLVHKLSVLCGNSERRHACHALAVCAMDGLGIPRSCTVRRKVGGGIVGWTWGRCGEG